MDSNPNRARIDQYFSSKKKRKTLSPAKKSGGGEREPQIHVEGSRSAKALVGGFLQSFKKDSSSEASNSSCEEKALLRGEGKGDSERCLDRVKFESSPGTSETGKGVLGNASSEAGPVAKNPELCEFAAGFLSLYCSEIQPSLNFRSQEKEIAFQVEESSSKKRRCGSDENDSYVKNTLDCSPVDIGAKILCKSIGLSSLLEKGNPLVSPAELRKCNHATSLAMADCQTTGSSDTVNGAAGTPHSSKGSLNISPGEAFWNEVINVADGLVINDGLCSHVGKDNRALNVVSGHFTSEKVKVSCHDNMLNMGTDGMNCDDELHSPRGLVRMQGKHPEKEVSPLPVKHIDFGSEVKDFDNGKDANICRVAAPEKKGIVCASVQHCFQNTALVTASKSTKNKVMETWHITSGNSTSNSSTHECSAVASIQECKSNGTARSLTKGCFRIDNWLPLEICNVYKKKGISELYQWQVDCLQVDGVLNNRNLIYCASTSAGKSFVAEILMLRRILATGKIAFLVLPYVSICSEKAEHLEALLEPVGKHVRSFYGNQGGSNLPKDTFVAVCTIEKANSLINKLLEEGRISELGTVVIDELHMVGDQSRGYLLELMLTKLLYAAGEGNVDSFSGDSSRSSRTSSEKSDTSCTLQIIGMSATLPNVAAVAQWLHAALYVTHFRPVPLEEYIKVGNTIYNKEMEIVRSIPMAANLGGKDPDQIVELCNEVVQEGHSVLIFCSSRKGCETTARHIAKYLKGFSMGPSVGDRDSFDISFALESLRRSPAGLDPILEETLPFGVAYHHAGLTVEERETVETCYRKGFVRVLTATSTLAAGVNLPARRVIFRQPRIGRDFIDGTRYKQMAGRAGRSGIDTKGESVLICKPEEAKKVLALVNDNCPPLCSCLSEDRNGMTHAILEVVAGGIVQTANDINRYVRCTLLHSTKPFEDVVKSAQDSLRWLCHKKFLEWNEETKLYTTTPLGRASFGSSLCPEESLVVLDDLMRAREGFVLASDLHLVYLVTPINVDVEPDWELYYERFMQLSLLDQSVGNRVGVHESFLMQMAHGAPSKPLIRSRNNVMAKGKCGNVLTLAHGSSLTNEKMIRVCKRFYVALILSRIVQEVPIGEVCEGFKVARGMVQSLQENAGRFASMVSVFCERLSWHDLESLVTKFQNRVSFGVRAEIAELTAIPYVKGSRARALYMAGLRTPQAVAEASIPEIMKALFESSSWDSHAVSSMQVGVSKKIKNGARKIVLEKAEEARAAAFSAFKSLGFELPQFTRPVFSFKTKNDIQKELTSSSEEDRRSVYAVSSKFKQNINPVLSGHNIVGSETEVGEKCIKTEGVDIGSLVEKPASKVTTGISNTKEIALTHFQEGPVSAASIPGGVDSFLDLWNATSAFFFDVHYTKKSEFHSRIPFEIHGIAICWENSPVYYLNIPKDLLRCNAPNNNIKAHKDINLPQLQMEMLNQRWARISSMMARDVRKFSWNLKSQMQVLNCPSVGASKFGSLHGGIKNIGVELMDNSFMFTPVRVRCAIDMAVVAWILSPDEEKSSYPNLEKEVKKRLSSDAAASAKRSGRWKDQMRAAAHNGCCRRVAQTRALYSVLWKLLESENLMEPLLAIEVQVTNVLADMEMWGIGVDMEGCLRSRSILGKKLRCLEKEAYRLAGKKFSLSMPTEVSNVLYEHLKLPVPELLKGKQHPSTDKHCLDLLRNEHPLVSIIKEYRTLSKLLHSTLGSICSLAKLCVKSQRYTVHGHWLQTSTATGRLSMQEPNLQCVEHTIEFNMKDDDEEPCLYNINARSLFVPSQEEWLLLTADYSQIELRLVAHFSKDSTLIKLLSSPENDVFTMIAAKWNNKHESIVTPQERDETKRLVYGLLYGMGPEKLSEGLDCCPNEAAERIQNFKNSFPGIASWLQDAVNTCRLKGYVKTLKGRKRYLTKIKHGSGKEKSKAQRQAVNSICQGSAADIIKIAMIHLHGMIDEFGEAACPSFLQNENFQMLKGRCRILLQVHDELLLEVDPLYVKEAGSLLRLCMENAVTLAVPLPVKLNIGKTWGTMEPYVLNS